MNIRQYTEDTRLMVIGQVYTMTIAIGVLYVVGAQPISSKMLKRWPWGIVSVKRDINLT
jgi:hypothetical protein